MIIEKLFGFVTSLKYFQSKPNIKSLKDTDLLIQESTID